jgi:hypothetical protein
MEQLTFGKLPIAERAFKIGEPLDVGFGFGPEALIAAAQRPRPMLGIADRSPAEIKVQSLVTPHSLNKVADTQKRSEQSGNLRWDTPSVRSKGTTQAAPGQVMSVQPMSRQDAPAVDFGHMSSVASTPKTLDFSAALLGEKPSRWSVLLAVCVDASLCFALLAASQLAVFIGGWQEILSILLAEPNVSGPLQKFSAALSGPLGYFGLKSPNSETLAQLGLVLGGWILLVWAVQIFCVSAWRGTLGRTLAGIRVNPIASRSSGRIGMPIFEVLTFGGLFTLPIALLRPDKHVFLSKLRYHTH